MKNKDKENLDSEDLNEEDVEEKLGDVTLSESSYTSPVISRAAENRLTVDMLSTEIPIIREGEAAQQELDSNSRISPKKRQELANKVRASQKAKERLFAAALPLIRTVAVREYRRRQQWGSRVPMDDLMQEAIVGFFKGIAGFKTESIRKSATNYLGQWMLVEMRRAAEVMDHDLQVGHDAGERFRRVRALRSRLVNDLGREPTDEEISEASRNSDYVTRPGMVGKAPTTGEQPKTGKGLTVNQVAEERNSRDRVGQVARMANLTDGDQESSGHGHGVVDEGRIIGSVEGELSTFDPAEIAAETQSTAVISGLVSRVLIEIRLPEMQHEVISRRYGLSPYEEEASARSIAKVMGIHRERVSRILTAFTAEMTTSGGPFHRIVAELSSDDLSALGLAWLEEALGPWDSRLGDVHKIPNILTDDPTMSPKSENKTDLETTAVGVLAWFQCDYEDKTFNSLYMDKTGVPKARPCPSCRKESYLVKMISKDK